MYILIYFIIYYHNVHKNLLKRLKFTKTHAQKYLQTVHGDFHSQEKYKQM